MCMNYFLILIILHAYIRIILYYYNNNCAQYGYMYFFAA
jgi:hypothetical protein